MSRRKPRPAPVATIVPNGDVGRFRVVYPDGSASEMMTLAECRELVRLAELAKSPWGYR